MPGGVVASEEDVLHVRTLPDFGGRLSAHAAEQLLCYLTAPYVRIPLVLRLLAHSDRLPALASPQLQGITQEQSSTFIQVILTALKTQATEVASSSQQPQRQQEEAAQVQRNSEEEDLSTDGEMDEDEKEVAEANRKDGYVAPATKKRMKTSEKKEKEKKAKILKSIAKCFI